MDELLTIGDFSLACGLSARVLRSYAGIGLLPPVAVDRWTGYRYYAPVQLQQAKVIGLLRQAGMPLRDIAGLLTDPAPSRLDEWERSLGRELASRRQALAAARHELGTALATTPPATDDAGLPEWPATVLASGSASARGPARDANQDAVLAAGDLFAVADGLGPAGRAGSLLATEVLNAAVSAESSLDCASLVRACQAANTAIWRHAGQPAEPTMGATLTAATLTATGTALSLVHVGDSRAYLVHDGRLRRLTEDHTLVAGLVRAGQLTEADARRHPQRALLTRALGTSPGVEPFSAMVTFVPGDRLLLCTDGVTSVLTDEQLAAVLAGHGPPGALAAELVQMALAHGGQDDTSAVIAEAPPQAAEAAPPDGRRHRRR